jgi:pimeloyl-ACP methyl ester carboxylesterase
LAGRFRVVAVDLPGFGDSDKPIGAAYDAPFFADVMIDLLDALGLDHANLIGNSAGCSSRPAGTTARPPPAGSPSNAAKTGSPRAPVLSRLQVTWGGPPPGNDPCQPSANGGYLGAQNRAIYVQVTDYDPDSGQFGLLWGWDNASFLYRVTLAAGGDLQLDRARSTTTTALPPGRPCNCCAPPPRW